MKNRRTSYGRYAWDFIADGFYEDAESGKVLVVLGPGKVYSGRIRKRPRRGGLGCYKSVVYRRGKKIVEKYLGVDYSSQSVVKGGKS